MQVFHSRILATSWSRRDMISSCVSRSSTSTGAHDNCCKRKRNIDARARGGGGGVFQLPHATAVHGGAPQRGKPETASKRKTRRSFGHCRLFPTVRMCLRAQNVSSIHTIPFHRERQKASTDADENQERKKSNRPVLLLLRGEACSREDSAKKRGVQQYRGRGNVGVAKQGSAVGSSTTFQTTAFLDGSNV